MQRSFRVGQSNELIKEGKIYDLHNDYLPTLIVFDTQKHTLRIVFKNLTADCDEGKRLALVFFDVDVLEFSGNIAATGTFGVDEIGYKDVDDYDYDWLSTEAQSEGSDHLILRFDGGATLRLHSANADILEETTLTRLDAV